jgi:transposase
VARWKTWLANIPPCLIGMEACVGAHHLSRKLKMLGQASPNRGFLPWWFSTFDE